MILEFTPSKILYESGDFVVWCDKEGNKASGELINIESKKSLLKETILLEGEWGESKYGKRFVFKGFAFKDGAKANLVFFLKKIAKPGRSIVKALLALDADTVIKALDENPSFLLEVKGLNEEKMGELVAKWTEYKSYADLVEFLLPLDVTENMIIRIYKKFGISAKRLISENPYVILAVDGVGFKKADLFAQKLDIDEDDIRRYEALVMYSVKQALDSDGSTYITAEEIEDVALREVEDLDLTLLLDAIENIINSGELVRFGSEDKITTARYLNMEKYIVAWLKNAAKVKRGALQTNIDAFIADFEARNNIKFSQEQSEFIRLANEQPGVCALSGYAGTGKTSVSKAVAELYEKHYGYENITGCALAGVAANRFKIQTGFQSGTLHSVLGFRGDGWVFGEQNKLPYKVVFLDESGMVDIELFYRLCLALDPTQTTLVKVGDQGQLAPVGSGNIFSDALASQIVPCVVLEKIFRQSEDKVIAVYANEIRKGAAPKNYKQNNFSDFKFIDRSIPNYFKQKNSLTEAEMKKLRDQNSKNILTALCDYAEKQKRDYIAIVKESGGVVVPQEYITFFQVLTPVKAGILGVANLNMMLQNVFNPNKEGIVINDKLTIRVHDRVIHKGNQDMQVCEAALASEKIKTGENILDEDLTEKRVYNGQLGFVLAIDQNNKEVLVLYPNENYVAIYEVADIRGGLLDLAYALTVHKTQGAEFKRVAVVVSISHLYQMLSGRLLYTAITRAKEEVALIGESYAFEAACKKLDNRPRKTLFREIASHKKAEKMI